MFSASAVRRFTSLFGLPFVLVSCVVNDPTTPSVTSALRNNKTDQPASSNIQTATDSPSRFRPEKPLPTSTPPQPASAVDSPIATIEGRPIYR
ncbi:MAG: hypothetical protein AABZ47_14585, partial [Planctomycetota bacterium]